MLARGTLVAVLFTLLYLAFPTREYYWDGVAFAIQIETTRDWHKFFSVHHLFYDFVGEALYRLSGTHIRVLYLLQWTNCLAGGVLLGLAYRLFRSFDVPVTNCAACMAIVGASATFWKFTTDVDSYILANIFLVATYLSLSRSVGLSRSVARGALLHVCAMMMHQVSALFYPVGLALIWRRSRERFWHDAALYTLISAVGTLAIYAVAFRLSTAREASTLLGWLTFHADLPFSFSLVNSSRWLALGTGRLLIGGKLSKTAYFAGPVSAIFLGFMAAGFWRARSRFRSVLSVWPLLVWIVVYAAFLLFWEPHGTVYRIFYLIPLIALLAVATRAISARPLVFLACALLCWNFSQFIYPKTRVENNLPLAAALEERKNWPQGTAVIFGEFVTDLWTIRYFNPQVTWIGIDTPDPARVAAYAAQFERDGGSVYLDWTYLQRSGQPVPRFTFQRVENVTHKLQ